MLFRSGPGSPRNGADPQCATAPRLPAQSARTGARRPTRVSWYPQPFQASTPVLRCARLATRSSSGRIRGFLPARAPAAGAQVTALPRPSPCRMDFAHMYQVYKSRRGIKRSEDSKVRAPRPSGPQPLARAEFPVKVFSLCGWRGYARRGLCASTEWPGEEGVEVRCGSGCDSAPLPRLLEPRGGGGEGLLTPFLPRPPSPRALRRRPTNCRTGSSRKRDVTGLTSASPS